MGTEHKTVRLHPAGSTVRILCGVYLIRPESGLQDGVMFHGPCHLRINLASPRARIEEAFHRIVTSRHAMWMKKAK